MITLSTFFGVCLFGHDSDRIRVRNEEGKLMLRCQSCNHDLPILADPVIYGPAHTPPEVKGQPTFVKTTKKKMRVATNAHGGRGDLGPSQPVSFARRIK